MKPPSARVEIGDCLAVLPTLDPASVHCCVTSPPYWCLRDYGVDGQMGLEPTPEAYVAKLVAVFREVRRVLRDDGTLWLNLGDSYFTNWGSVRSEGGAGMIENERSRRKDGARLAKQMVGIPWRVAFALQADGWYLRQDIIWHKPNPMPESVTDRCTKAHEYLFLLSKSPRYYFDQGAWKEPALRSERTAFPHGWGIGDEPRTAVEFQQEGIHPKSREDSRPITDGPPVETRNRRSVWTIATSPYKEAHFATFPPKLVEPCILAGCPQGGTVLDPFAGSGTTGKVALEHGRSAILIELNPQYLPLINQRLSITLPLPFTQ